VGGGGGGADPDNVAAGGATDARCGERGVTLDKRVMFAHLPSAFSPPSTFLLQCFLRLFLAGCEALSREKIRSIGSQHYHCNFLLLQDFNFKSNRNY
jgi:hypothetical protein